MDLISHMGTYTTFFTVFLIFFYLIQTKLVTHKGDAQQHEDITALPSYQPLLNHHQFREIRAMGVYLR